MQIGVGLNYLIALVKADRMMFGTNWPLTSNEMINLSPLD
jgi:predicted TIM-barrel fold metal-dependent hydrolase